MTNRKLLLVVVMLSLVALLFTGLGAGNGADKEQVDPVSVPVILDGVRYEPGEFNRVHQELHSQGIYLDFTIDQQTGDYLAFTTKGGFNEWAVQRGLPLPFPGLAGGDSPAQPEQEGSSVSNVEPEAWQWPDPYWSRNWEHKNCEGDCLLVPPNYYISNLTIFGFNDKISSVQPASGIVEEVLWEHKNAQGDALEVPAGQTYMNLKYWDFNDKASSLWTNIYF